MKAVFADTVFFVGLLNRLDQHHASAQRFHAGFAGLLITTEYVLLEVANFFTKPGNREVFVTLIDQLHRDPDTEIVPASPDHFAAGLKLFAARPDKEWSLTDCISFNVMTDRNLTDALTADKHFEQAGFRILL